MAVGERELENRFGFHPATQDTAPKHASVREVCLNLAIWLDDYLPDGRDKATALTKLQEVMHWSNSAIAMTAPLSDKPQVANPKYST